MHTDWTQAVMALREYTTKLMLNQPPSIAPPADDIATPINPDQPPDAVLIVRTTMRRFADGHAGLLKVMQARGLRVHVMTNPRTLHEQWYGGVVKWLFSDGISLMLCFWGTTK